MSSCEGGKLLARDMSKINGAKCFTALHHGLGGWVGDEDKKADLARTISAKDRHVYEVIRERRPCVAYMDLDGDRDQVSGEVLIPRLLALWEEYTYGAECFRRAVVMNSDRGRTSRKLSFHVVFPDTCFENNHVTLKRFMAGFLHFVHAEKRDPLFTYHSADGGGKKSVIDGKVYTRNRCFRALGQTKLGSAGPLRIWKGFACATGKDYEWLAQPFGLLADEGKIAEAGNVLTRRFSSVIDQIPARSKKERYIAARIPRRYKKPTSVVVIGKDDDFLQCYEASELKEDFTGAFLPFLQCLAKTVDPATLLDWCTEDDEKREKYARIIERYREEEVNFWISGDFVLKRLKRDGVKVTDARREYRLYPTPRVEAALPTSADGWKPADVKSGELVTELSRLYDRDKRANLPTKRLIYVTGQMGAAKTTSVREAIAALIMTGRLNSVLYLVPRISLADESARALKGSMLRYASNRQNHAWKTRPVRMRLYHGGRPVWDKSEEYIGDGEEEAATLDVAVVNSAWRTKEEEYDAVVWDEPQVSMSNFFQGLQTGRYGGTPHDQRRSDDRAYSPTYN